MTRLPPTIEVEEAAALTSEGFFFSGLAGTTSGCFGKLGSLWTVTLEVGMGAASCTGCVAGENYHWV